MENGYICSVEFAIHIYFDNINQDFLINKIQNHISDDKILNLIITYLKCTVIDDHTTYKKDEGILQGGQLSPLFSNIYIYMNELDHYMDENDYHFCRFGDDINIYCKTYDDAIKILGDVREHIENAEMLPLNHKKTGVYKGTNRKYLGFRFEKKGSKIIAKREKKAYKTVYRDWYTTGIQRIDSSYHLVNEGILTRRDFNVLFENDEGKKYIPVETTDSIYVYSNVILSGNFFEFINNHRS